MMSSTLHSRFRFRVTKRRLEGFVLLLGLLFVLYAYTSSTGAKVTLNSSLATEEPAFQLSEDENVTPSWDESEVLPVENPESGTGDYSRFQHNNNFHSRLPCLLCHTRETNSPRMGFPGKSGHLPCAGCHAVQFSDQSSPMCNICHTNPQSGAMKRFPGLKSFRGKFDHSSHRRQNCATCHTPAGRGGAAKRIPTGANAHSTCFQCHTSNSSHSMSSCNVCHEQGRRVWSSENAGAFRKGFSHSEHGRRSLSCNSCHSLLRSGARSGDQMSSPRVQMHFAPAGSVSCGGCHNSKRAFGTEDFANCKRCHNPGSFKF